jgi:hypothetical protein
MVEKAGREGEHDRNKKSLRLGRVCGAFMLKLKKGTEGKKSSHHENTFLPV